MRKIGRIGDFAVACSGLLPANVREPEFLSALSRRLPRIADLEPRVWAALAADPDYIALCHWNANIDNAWFWRDAAGVLRCGLMDWGCVSRMNVGMALWGSLSAAETSPWDTRFVEFTRVFAREFAYAGGPRSSSGLQVDATAAAAGNAVAGVESPTPTWSATSPG